MKKYIVTYDLNKQGQDYTSLTNAIQKYNNKHVMYSVWFIKTNETATDISNNLIRYIDKNDNLFISEINDNRNGFLSKDLWDYLSN